MNAFWNALFWEFLQNLPVITGFVSAVWLWSRRERAKAIGCAVAGSIVGALVIRFTEVLASGGRESIAVTLVNVSTFGLFQIAFSAYFGAQKWWSNWKMDLALGGLCGALLAIAQGIASPQAPLVSIVLHSVSLALAGGLVLVGIRSLNKRPLLPALLYALLIVAAMTIVIGIIDYGYLLL